MNIYELCTYVEDGTDEMVRCGWHREKISRGNECKTLTVKSASMTTEWQTYKYPVPEKLRSMIYAKHGIKDKQQLF